MDTIANMIVALKNAGDAGRDKVQTSFSKMKEDIAKVLEKEGFIKGFEKKLKGGKAILEINLLLDNRVPRIQGVKRISKTSKRIYKKANELRPVKSGYGVLVITTPKGVMSSTDAKKTGVGGEVLFSIW